jgi:hypothetical protein
MTRDLPRLRDSSGSELGRRLLRSAAGDAAPAQSRKRALAAAGLAASTVVVSSGTAAAGLAASTMALTLKWVGVGFLAGTVTLGAASISIDRREDSRATVDERREAPQSPEADRAARALAAPERMTGEPAAPPPAATRESESSVSSRSVAPRPAGTPSPAALRPAPPAAAPAIGTQAPSRSFALEREAPEAAAPSVSKGDAFEVELGLVDQARRAIAADRPDVALSLLDRLDRESRTRSFGPEATVIRIEALMHAGDRSTAERLARDFVARHPNHPLVERVQGLVQQRNRGGK